MPERPPENDRDRGRRIERLLAKYRAGRLTANDRAILDQLIDADYREAIVRADRLIAARVRSAPRPGKRSRK